MPKFLFLQRSDCNARPEMTLMASCMEWMQSGTKEGWLLDPGAPLTAQGAVVEPDLNVIDGPFTEAKELVGGYTIVEAADLDAACELAKKTISMTGAGRIEVRQMANVGQ